MNFDGAGYHCFMSHVKQNTNKTAVNKINALDLIGSSNTAVISLGSQDYILRLTRHNKLILTK